ncbi:hypothetical protein AWB76_00916 [Caballeronia temeraria]|uniref:Uncharacterized protein n=1 Tax=Caballeronia temeraria TaxID=1777137 RepID=A0A157ZLR7_9BURK|nr:hypothetical protein [Caballeronia temeraria]SAK46455.1 hypothetical protein AWB76_00916 [Caballeronia temeraria]
MQERHLFVFQMREAEQMTLKELAEDGLAVFELNKQINEWITDNDLRDLVEYQPPRQIVTKKMIAFEAPSWEFRDEYHALQFKMIFGTRFEYQIYDAE